MRRASIAVAFAIVACSRNPPTPASTSWPPDTAPSATPAPSAPSIVSTDAAPSGAVAVPEDASPPSDDPMAIHFETADDLMSLVWLPALADGGAASTRGLTYFIGPRPGHF